MTVRGEGSEVLTSLSVSLGTSASKFSGAVDKTGRIYIEGQVRGLALRLGWDGAGGVDLGACGQDQPHLH